MNIGHAAYFKLDHMSQVVQPAPKTAKKESWVKSKEEIEAEEIATGAVATYQGDNFLELALKMPQL